MALTDLKRLRQDVDEITLRLNSLNITGGSAASPSPLTDFAPVTPAVQVPAANQLRNGDLSHSVNTYNEAVAAPGTDKVKECAWCYSNDAPSVGQTLALTNALTSAVNKTLKTAAHSTHDVNYADWDATKGIGRMQGLKTIDLPFPSNVATPGKTEALGLIAAFYHDPARPTLQIIAPSASQLYAGIWDNTASQRDWLKGAPFALNFLVRGAPATTTQRKYKVFAFTDRGYTFLSAEIDVVNAPSDAAFNAGADVYLSWERIPGVIEYQIYRHDIVAGVFHLLESPGAANTYADNGTIADKTVAGYPAATDDRAKAYVATKEGELTELAVDGVSAAWSKLFMNIPVPQTYNQGNTTAEQWLRLGLTVALDRQCEASATNGSNQVTAADAGFTALDTGRTARFYDADGTLIKEETITFVDATHVTFATNFTASYAGGLIYIVGGGDHGLLFDLVHLSYHTQAVYAPYADDLNRALQPTAVPNGSTQGGVGDGGGGSRDPGDGGLACIALDCPVNVLWGERLKSVLYRDILRGYALFGGDTLPNQVCRLRQGRTENLCIVRTWNGVELLCSPTHELRVGRNGAKRTLHNLQVGDFVLTSINGRVERSRIREIVETHQSAFVGTFELEPGHTYSAGKRYARNWFEKMFWFWFKRQVVGILSSNIKRDAFL